MRENKRMFPLSQGTAISMNLRNLLHLDFEPKVYNPPRHPPHRAVGPNCFHSKDNLTMPSLLLLLTQRSKALWAFNFVIALMLAPAWKAVAQSDLTPSSAGLTVTPLYNFGFDTSKGSGLVSSLVADKEGALYGTTNKGGDFGVGTVFKLTPPAPGHKSWTETVLHSFFGADVGSYPAAGLIFDQQGVVLYGTTEKGGFEPLSPGYGTVFKLVPPAPGHKSWRKTDIYDFCAVGYYCNDGEYPVSELVIGKDLALYGTTYEGGANGYGTVFKLTPPASGTYWNETVLYSFGDGNDGGYPKAGLIVDKQGVLYGTTYEGGSSGYGTVSLASENVRF